MSTVTTVTSVRCFYIAKDGNKEVEHRNVAYHTKQAQCLAVLRTQCRLYGSLYGHGHAQGGPKILHNFCTTSNINRFKKLIYCQNQEKICTNTTTRDPTTPQACYLMKCHWGWENCRSISLITSLVSGVAGLNASSSSNVDTLNI